LYELPLYELPLYELPLYELALYDFTLSHKIVTGLVGDAAAGADVGHSDVRVDRVVSHKWDEGVPLHKKSLFFSFLDSSHLKTI
jgi:hypothetical protein